ncbi:MAG: NAD(P)-binding domain-containing protein [bacterium]|nr:MAG: NAD(P)-binding domain-containing protein [bacterium]
MTNPIYVIAGATGNIGQRVSLQLLAAGKKVRVVGRDIKRLEPLAQAGAEVFVGSLNDKDFLLKAFDSVYAAMVMIPPTHTAKDLFAYQREIGQAQAQAVVANSVPYVVTISSVGAHLSEGTGSILGLYENEQFFNSLKDINVVHLRTGYFMENFFYSIPVIKKANINASPIAPDTLLDMVATQDVASLATDFLQGLSFVGKNAYEIVGTHSLTMLEATKILGNAIDKPELRYVQLSYEKARQAMLAGGMSESVVNAVIEMNQACNNGLVKALRIPSLLKYGATSLEVFAKEFASVFYFNQSFLAF